MSITYDQADGTITKARSLETRWGIGYPASQDQWWQLNESGKLWELWEESHTVLLQRVASLRTSSVIWAERWTPENAHILKERTED